MPGHFSVSVDKQPSLRNDTIITEAAAEMTQYLNHRGSTSVIIVSFLQVVYPLKNPSTVCLDYTSVFKGSSSVLMGVARGRTELFVKILYKISLLKP